MRIVKLVVVLLIAVCSVLPQTTLASEKSINVEENKNTFSEIIGLLSPGSITMREKASRDKMKTDFILKKETKSKEDIKREQVLNKWKEKQYKKWKNLPEGQFRINASAYTAAADECGKNDGITASGLKVKENRTIACPKEFPFGVKLKIEGMGIYTCEDRGGAIKGNKIDIYMETKKEAFRFGRQHLKAEIIKG